MTAPEMYRALRALQLDLAGLRATQTTHDDESNDPAPLALIDGEPTVSEDGDRETYEAAWARGQAAIDALWAANPDIADDVRALLEANEEAPIVYADDALPSALPTPS